MNNSARLLIGGIVFFSVSLSLHSQDGPFQVRYAKGLQIGDSVVNITPTPAPALPKAASPAPTAAAPLVSPTIQPVTKTALVPKGTVAPASVPPTLRVRSKTLSRKERRELKRQGINVKRKHNRDEEAGTKD